MRQMSEREFRRRVKESERFISQLDYLHGFVDRHPANICAFLEASIRERDLDCQFHAFVMLKQVCRVCGRN